MEKKDLFSIVYVQVVCILKITPLKKILKFNFPLWLNIKLKMFLVGKSFGNSLA